MKKTKNQRVPRYVVPAFKAFMEQAYSELGALPPSKRMDALKRILSAFIKHLPTRRVVQMRDAFARKVAEKPAASAIIELVDGQLALRQVAGKKKWR